MDYKNQLDILNPRDIVWPCHIIGLGGIGSAVAPVLAKLGMPELHLWDNDILEESNIPGQLLYREKDVGKLKVQAAKEILSDCGCRDIITHEKPFIPHEDVIEGIIISGVHSMEKDEQGRPGRLDIWESIKYNVDVSLYLDGRLGGEILELYTVRPSLADDIEVYEKSLFPNSETAPLPCAARAVIYPAVILAGLIPANITRWMRGERYFRKIMFDSKTTTFLAYHQT